MTMRRGRGLLEVLAQWGRGRLLLGMWVLVVAGAEVGGGGSHWNGSGARGGPEHETGRGTIAFATVGRARFAFDLFAVKLPEFWVKNSSSGPLSAAGVLEEIRLTDGISINYNGQLVEGQARSAVLERVRVQGVKVEDDSNVQVFVSERDGSTRIYFNIVSEGIETTRQSEIELMLSEHSRRQGLLEIEFSKTRGVVLDVGLHSNGPVLFDRPSVVGDSIFYVSTKEAHESPRQSWTAVYSTNVKTQITKRLTPIGTADFSPSVSPSGKWVAVASSASGFQGETTELSTDLYVCKAYDGSNRLLVVTHAGWPSWANEHTIFFHRQAEDGWWSVFRVTLPEMFLTTGVGVVQEERITPPGVHAVTPAASPTGTWVAVATRRPGSLIRHVEIFDLISNSFIKLTEKISPDINHYNPFVSSYSGLVGYHRCRGNSGVASVVPLLQEVRSPSPDLALVRVDGTFPTFSPDGSLLAFVRNAEDSTQEISESESGLWVSNANGSGARLVFSGLAFSPAWDKKRMNVIYASNGPEFSFKKPVQIVAVHNVDGRGKMFSKELTKTGNNAFPSPSPDGRYLVFRSTRSGNRNLFIMDAEHGEEKELRQLTDGPWTDQHPNWSPSGEWIAFISDREDPGAGSFSIYLIRPDGTGLRKVLQSDHSGLTVHPIFSPDGRKLVFVSDLAGVSGEPVAQPFQFQPYGEIFMADVDGSNVERLTHNSFEDGTPTWSPSFLQFSDLSTEGLILSCNVEDARWLNSEVHHSCQCPSRPLPPIRCS